MDKVMPSCTASLNCERNRNQLSQPDTDRINLKLPGRINGRHTHWEDAMQHPEQRDPEATMSRRTLVHGLAICAGATVAGASGALAQGGLKAARWRRRPRSPARRAISVRAAPRPPISGTPTSSRSTRPSTTSPSPTRRSSACTPGCCGPKARPGARRAAISCGATFPTTGRCDGRRTTVTSASSARRPTTPTATRSISRAASSPANISPAAWCAMSTTAPRPCWPIIFNGKKLNSPNDVVAHPGWQLLVHRSALWRPAL